METNIETWLPEARGLAAQCWCDEETSGKEMDATLAEAVARRIAPLLADAARYRWLRDSKNAYPLFFIAQRDPNNVVVQFTGELADMNIDEMMRANGSGERGRACATSARPRGSASSED